MKTWLKRTLIGVFGASILVGGMAACSHRGAHGGYGWHAMNDEDAAKMKARLIEKAGSRLDLDDAQKAKLGVLADTLRAQRNALVGPTTDPRTELQSLVAGPTFDRAKAKSLVDAKTGAITAKAPKSSPPWPTSTTASSPSSRPRCASSWPAAAAGATARKLRPWPGMPGAAQCPACRACC